MEYKIKNEKVEDFFEVVDDLEKLLTDRMWLKLCSEHR